MDGRSYCIVDKGYFTHPIAVALCKKHNARLPLPRNKKEVDEFIKIGGEEWTNVDARNPKKTNNPSEWVDAENKPLGKRLIYPRDQKIFSNNNSSKVTAKI